MYMYSYDLSIDEIKLIYIINTIRKTETNGINLITCCHYSIPSINIIMILNQIKNQKHFNP